jgi:hypothetical protein
MFTPHAVVLPVATFSAARCPHAGAITVLVIRDYDTVYLGSGCSMSEVFRRWIRYGA